MIIIILIETPIKMIKITSYIIAVGFFIAVRRFNFRIERSERKEIDTSSGNVINFNEARAQVLFSFNEIHIKLILMISVSFKQ